MKKYRWVVLGVVTLLVVAVLSYGWATALLDSLFAFRSPLAQSRNRSIRLIGVDVC